MIMQKAERKRAFERRAIIQYKRKDSRIIHKRKDSESIRGKKAGLQEKREQ